MRATKSNDRTIDRVLAFTMAYVNVWVRVFYAEAIEAFGDSIEVACERCANVNSLKNAVRKLCLPELAHCSAGTLKVYAPQTTVPVPAGTDSIDPGDVVPADTTSKKPLRVTTKVAAAARRERMRRTLVVAERTMQAQVPEEQIL
jgi:hypothetical protein